MVIYFFGSSLAHSICCYTLIINNVIHVLILNDIIDFENNKNTYKLTKKAIDCLNEDISYRSLVTSVITKHYH